MPKIVAACLFKAVVDSRQSSLVRVQEGHHIHHKEQRVFDGMRCLVTTFTCGLFLVI